METGASATPALSGSDASTAAVLSCIRVPRGTSRALNAAQQEMLRALGGNADGLAVSGVADCGIALDLAERGLVTVTAGSVTRGGGAGVIAASPCRTLAPEGFS